MLPLVALICTLLVVTGLQITVGAHSSYLPEYPVLFCSQGVTVATDGGGVVCPQADTLC